MQRPTEKSRSTRYRLKRKANQYRPGSTLQSASVFNPLSDSDDESEVGPGLCNEENRPTQYKRMPIRKEKKTDIQVSIVRSNSETADIATVPVDTRSQPSPTERRPASPGFVNSTDDESIVGLHVQPVETLKHTDKGWVGDICHGVISSSEGSLSEDSRGTSPIPWTGIAVQDNLNPDEDAYIYSSSSEGSVNLHQRRSKTNKYIRQLTTDDDNAISDGDPQEQHCENTTDNHALKDELQQPVIGPIIDEIFCQEIVSSGEESTGPDLSSTESRSTLEEDEDNGDIDDYIFPACGNTPLYHNAALTCADSFVSIMKTALKHKLTGSCLSDLVSLIDLHCPKPNNCAKSTHLLKKFFSKVGISPTYHYFCIACYGPLKNHDSECVHCADSKVGHFIEISIKHQLTALLKRPHFYELLQHRFTRQKLNPDGCEDIYDGSIYKDLNDTGFLSNPNNITFTWNTDGISPFNSSKYSLWPLYLAVNELPHNKRFLPENMIVAGLWFGSTKPDGNTFLRPLYDSLVELYEGILVSFPDGPRLIKARLLCGTCDLPAKCIILNMIQFNGSYGCARCKIKGETLSLGPRSRVHVYPYEEQLQPRTHKETIEHAAQVDLNKPGDHVYGVKGPSILSYAIPDMIRSTSTDVMHSLYIGVVKKLLHLWFDSSYSTQNFSLSTMVGIVDDKLLKIKPPSFVQRPPRSIKSHLSYWKASELKNWLYYYSIPVLESVMKEDYMDHHILLVSAVYTLNQNSITENELNVSNLSLNKYVEDFSSLYGPRFMSSNLHQLLHYVDVVRDLGPLWVTSCFPFEDLNGKLVSLIHGSRHAELQICSSLSFVLNLPHFINKLGGNSIAKKYLKKIDVGQPLKRNERIAPGITSLGCYKLLKPIPLNIREALVNSDEPCTGNCQLFYRLKIGSIIHTCRSYGKTGMKISYCIQYGDDNSVGIIEYFIRLSPCDCQEMCKCEAKYLAVVSMYGSEMVDASVKYLTKISPLRKKITIPVQDIKSLCFLVSVDKVLYCASPVNNRVEE